MMQQHDQTVDDRGTPQNSTPLSTDLNVPQIEDSQIRSFLQWHTGSLEKVK